MSTVVVQTASSSWCMSCRLQLHASKTEATWVGSRYSLATGTANGVTARNQGMCVVFCADISLLRVKVSANLPHSLVDESIKFH